MKQQRISDSTGTLESNDAVSQIYVTSRVQALNQKVRKKIITY